ncbi:MAG TPA: MAPEG family protein [Gammaproteobacteria bacterium]|nr:MAPEG family protein [Gammaproteobacteria bacterium]
MTSEYQMLVWSVILGLVQLVIAVVAAIKVRGLAWAFSPRDKVMPPLEGMAGRIDRAFSNFLETFPLFAALVLTAGALGVHGPMTQWGTMLYFWARVVYVPIYVLGLPVVRTGVWTVSAVGMVMLVLALL